MKIEVEKHNADWKNQFEMVKAEISRKIGFTNPQIAHIGSTSINGLSAKPIIDILVGLENASQLDEIVNPLLEQGYIYYKVYNAMMPYRRLFVKHKGDVGHLNIPDIIAGENDIPRSTEEHKLRLAHIHVLAYNSEDWIRHIAFRDYLTEYPDVRDAYQKLKESLTTRDWLDGNDYNKAKDAFIKIEETNAINWYNNRKAPSN